MVNKKAVLQALTLAIGAFAAGCSRTEQASTAPVTVETNKPVTLKVTINSTFLTDQEFETYVAVNTALREAEEALNKQIQSNLGKTTAQDYANWPALSGQKRLSINERERVKGWLRRSNTF